MSSSSETAKRPAFVSVIAVTMILLLTIQFLLGMGVNLTVHVSHANSGFGSMMTIMRGSPLLMIHMMLGIFSAAVALVALVATRSGTSAILLASGVVGLVAVLVAGYGGIRFLIGGGSASSFIMATGFIFAYAAYFVQVIADMSHSGRRIRD